jgi:hypothetical protein
MRSVLAIVALLAAFPAFAGEPDLSSPPATVRSYLAAIKANDLETAKRCWTIDDGNASGALDVVVGMWIASRKLVSVTQDKFGTEGLRHLGRWNRPAGSDKAIELTLDRLRSAESKEFKTFARLSIPWQTGDGDTVPAFLCIKAPLILRRVDDRWLLDANEFTGVEKAANLFGPKSVWSACRDETAVMNEVATAIEKGQIKNIGEFERELNTRVAALKARYERK